MKIYVIYRRRSKDEIKSLEDMETYNINPSEKIANKEVYAFTPSKKFAAEFMRIHSDKWFVMKVKHFDDENYYDFLEDNREKELYMVEARDRTHIIQIPMTEDEENEIQTVYYDDVLCVLPHLVEAIPSCRIFKEKYQKVLDLLAVSKAVFKSRIYNDPDMAASYDIEVDDSSIGECGFESPGLSPNSINIFVQEYQKHLRKGKKK